MPDTIIVTVQQYYPILFRHNCSVQVIRGCVYLLPSIVNFRKRIAPQLDAFTAHGMSNKNILYPKFHPKYGFQYMDGNTDFDILKVNITEETGND